MCYNPIIFEQWYDLSGKFHCHYFADFNPDVHTANYLTRLSLGCTRVGMRNHRYVVVPCGKCKLCRARHSRDWKVRLFHHSLTEGDSIFVTLTYNDDNMDEPHLNYRHFQLFMKQLRYKFRNRKITYFVAGEYGTNTLRRHFHAIIFGLDIKDVKTKFLCTSRKDKNIKIWTSDILLQCWGNRGYVSVSRICEGDYRAFGYVAGYIISKSDEKHVRLLKSNELKEEFHHMSLKPAIAKQYFLMNYKHIYRNDFIIFNGRKTRVPRAYDKWYEKITTKLVLREGVNGHGCLKQLNSISSVQLKMAYIFNMTDEFALTVDKVSDFDIIKKKRRYAASTCTLSDYNLSSRKVNMFSALGNYIRDIDNTLMEVVV